MLPTPSTFTLVSGYGEDVTPLNAFDRALLNAGAGNLNLVKISSILPPYSSYIAHLHIPPGSLVPTAFSSISSTHPGETIAAAVAVGIPEDEGSFGVIMECSGLCTKQELEERIQTMVIHAFKTREKDWKEIKVSAIEHQIIQCGSVFAGVLLWYD